MGARTVTVTLACGRGVAGRRCQSRVRLLLHRVVTSSHGRSRRATTRQTVLSVTRSTVAAGGTATLTLRLTAAAARTLGHAGRFDTLQVVVNSATGTVSRSLLVRSARRR